MLGVANQSSEERLELGEPKLYCGRSCEQQLGNRPSTTFRKKDGTGKSLLSFLEVKLISGSPNSLGRTSIPLAFTGQEQTSSI